MPGQIALEPRYYPADFQCNSYCFKLLTNEVQVNWALLAPDKTVVVDSIQIFFPTELITNARNVKFKVTTGILPTYATASQDVTTAQALSISSGDYPFEKTMTFATTNGTPNNNIIPAGSVLWMNFDNSLAFTAATSINVLVRWRSQL
jgi:hypothetical protein